MNEISKEKVEPKVYNRRDALKRMKTAALGVAIAFGSGGVVSTVNAKGHTNSYGNSHKDCRGPDGHNNTYSDGHSNYNN
jgi:hypothetical protein